MISYAEITAAFELFVRMQHEVYHLLKILEQEDGDMRFSDIYGMYRVLTCMALK